ncbi:MAG: hypothetical protein CSA50_03485 [Gammaproteobacteria bacterium]|nr:MAG: hypothetical protein CSA50_03485 [Gammaproteobacteria bacterium]
MTEKKFTRTITHVFLSILMLGGSSSIFATPSWNGNWQSSYASLDEPVMDTVYTSVAALKDDLEASDVESALKAMLHTDFNTINVENTGNLYSMTIDSVSTNYNYMGEHEVEFAPGTYFSWYKFEKIGGSADDLYKYIISTAAHQDTPDSMVHWHMRYGSQGFDALIGITDFWWPTMVAADMTAQELADQYTAMAGEFAEMLSPSQVPVPGSILLLGSGMLLLSGYRFRARLNVASVS